jgi:hypothetical protein
MIRMFIIAVSICATTLMATPSRAQELIDSYVAFLSVADHSAIIRQDRANFHRFGIRDPQDQDDKFFADEGNRAALEQMLENGKADPGVISRIVNGTVLIHVDIYRGPSGPFIRVIVLN